MSFRFQVSSSGDDVSVIKLSIARRNFSARNRTISKVFDAIVFVLIVHDFFLVSVTLTKTQVNCLEKHNRDRRRCKYRWSCFQF